MADAQEQSPLGSTPTDAGVVAPTTPTASNDNDVGAGLDIISKEFEKINAGQPPQQAPTAAPTPLPPPAIPAPPPPIPGSYSPEQEQASLQATEAISNPAERLRLQGVLKREYANQKLADGVTKQARDDAKNKSFADYSKAAHDLLTDTKTDWATKLTIMKRLNDVMWQDPTLDVGDSKELLQNHMVNIVGAPNEGKLGRGYTVAQDGVVNRTVTANEQILKMEQQGLLTHEGATWTMQSLKELNEPKGVVNTDRTEFFKRFSRSIAPRDALGEVTALGEQRLYLAERASRAREQELIERKGNPADVYNPDSKDYFGAPQNLAKYSVSLKEATDYAAAISKGGAVIPPPIKGDVPPPTSVSPAAPAPKPIDVSGMTRAEVLTKFKPGTSVLLPDGRVGVVPYPVIPMSR